MARCRKGWVRHKFAGPHRPAPLGQECLALVRSFLKPGAQSLTLSLTSGPDVLILVRTGPTMRRGGGMVYVCVALAIALVAMAVVQYRARRTLAEIERGLTTL